VTGNATRDTLRRKEASTKLKKKKNRGKKERGPTPQVCRYEKRANLDVIVLQLWVPAEGKKVEQSAFAKSILVVGTGGKGGKKHQ